MTDRTDRRKQDIVERTTEDLTEEEFNLLARIVQKTDAENKDILHLGESDIPVLHCKRFEIKEEEQGAMKVLSEMGIAVISGSSFAKKDNWKVLPDITIKEEYHLYVKELLKWK